MPLEPDDVQWQPKGATGVRMTEVTGTPSSFEPAMDSETAGQLEFAQALELVSQRAVSEAGAASVRRRVPFASTLGRRRRSHIGLTLLRYRAIIQGNTPAS